MANEIMKAAVFRSHFEAAQEIPDEHDRLLYLSAIVSYQLYGEIPEGLSPIVKALMTAILPVLDKESESKQGRPECEISAEEIAAAKEELGSAKAVAERYGIGERTVYRKLSELPKPSSADTDSHCQRLPTAKTAKTKEECRKKNEEGRKEKEEESASVACAPQAAEPPAPSPSPNSVMFPQAQAEREEKPKPKRAKPFVPPSVEEVAAYCKERRNGVDAQSFVAFYASKGWLVGNSKMKDWRQAVITWERRDKARASPEYETWIAPPPPDISEEERAAIVEGLNGVFAKLQGKCIAKEARR